MEHISPVTFGVFVCAVFSSLSHRLYLPRLRPSFLERDRSPLRHFHIITFIFGFLFSSILFLSLRPSFLLHVSHMLLSLLSAPPDLVIFFLFPPYFILLLLPLLFGMIFPLLQGVSSSSQPP